MCVCVCVCVCVFFLKDTLQNCPRPDPLCVASTIASSSPTPLRPPSQPYHHRACCVCNGHGRTHSLSTHPPRSTPHRCSGSTRWVHQRCILRWVNDSDRTCGGDRRGCPNGCGAMYTLKEGPPSLAVQVVAFPCFPVSSCCKRDLRILHQDIALAPCSLGGLLRTDTLWRTHARVNAHIIVALTYLHTPIPLTDPLLCTFHPHARTYI